MIRIGTDIGGTFTDIVWVDESTGEIKADKAPTTPADVVQGVMAAYAKTGVEADAVGQFIHGSTVATNALVTQRGAVTGLITTKGFRDILEIRRIDRPDEHIYNIFWEKPKPLVPRRRRLEISARMMFDGTVLEPVDEAEVRVVTEKLLEAGVQSIAVCLLHAYADPSHELTVRDIIREIDADIYVSMSHEVAREIREYERTSSTVIDAYVKKPVVGYLNRLDATLRDDTGLANSPLIANSTGGVSTVEAIGRAPIQMMESGPAGGAIGAAYLAEKLGTPNLVTGDVGGTSYDVSIVVDGKTLLRTEHEILGYAAKVSSIDVRSVGAGGGSIARVDVGGRLHVGPGSAGADPGPMCYDRGGSEPTVTDAAVVTGLIDPSLFAGGEMKLRPELATQGVEGIAQKLGLSTDETAEGILTVARNNMANITRQTLVGQGHDPRDFALLAFGGGGGLFASEVARALDIPNVIVPRHPSVFSAWGMLSADIVGSFARSYLKQIPQVDIDYVQRLFAEMESEALQLTDDAGVARENVTFHRSIDCRYTGQGHEVEVPLGEVPIDAKLVDILPELFDEVHEARFGHRMPSNRETVTYRLRVFGSMHRLPLVEIESGADSASDALVSTKQVFVNRAWRDAGIYDRSKLLAGATVKGPALVQEPSHVTVLMPGDTATVDSFGALAHLRGQLMSTTMPRGADPITVAVVHNALLAAAREMRETIQRTSFSPIIYEDRDFACGLLDADANTLAEAPGLTAFMGTLSPGIKKSFEERGKDDIEPGDVFCTSIPAFSGSHPADMMLWMPIFHEGRLFGFAASKAHLVDVGAKDPYPTDSTDAFQEGLRLPPVKLYRAGKLDETLAAVIKSNSRAPEIIWGDIHAQIACFRAGEQGVLRLLDKYGFETVNACVQEIFDHAERMARDAIRQMPAGTWSAVDYCDDNGIDRGVPVKVGVSITIDPNAAEVTFDFSESAPQQRGPMNAPIITAISCARMMGKILTAPDSVACEGSFRPIKVIAPLGSIFNAHDSAPTNLYGWPSMTAVETILKAMAADFPDRFPAQSGGDLCGCFRYGFDSVTGQMWVEANIEGIGQGASAFADGESAVVHIEEACSRNLPVELEETKDPEIIEFYELVPDSGGPGKFRGGLGVRRAYRLLADARMISTLERCNTPHSGVAGGLPGGRTIGILDSSIYGQGCEFIKTPDQPLAKGDVMTIVTGGGGGYGNPLERDPARVAEDVLEGLVSAGAAKEFYGVIFDIDGNLDLVATEALRAAQRAA